MIKAEDVKKLSQLARISVSDSEVEELRTDISAILGYVDKLNEVREEAGSEHVRAYSDARTVMRDDTDAHEPGLYTDSLLAEAPATENGFYKVKKILGNTDE
ncbi:Asp-tRNA(Asn)/Glu-tRNA(Gln) amidotransferase GatCAB subunit C [Candidatus Wolfebacteria bacterium]|nr:MAG: Asp-tRNA(Asn)/Glu-tRNA(Gln) amidotransferase GatCAB subunit C [Candidatus Wolfebacteria bacterium]